MESAINAIEEAMLFAQRKIERLEREKSDLKKQLEETEIELYDKTEKIGNAKSTIQRLETKINKLADEEYDFEFIKYEYNRMMSSVPYNRKCVGPKMSLEQLIVIAKLRGILYKGLSREDLMKKINGASLVY